MKYKIFDVVELKNGNKATILEDNNNNTYKAEIANKEDEEKTYIGEGMLIGVVIGTVIGAVIGIFTKILYMPIFTSICMMIGLTIGSGIKKKKK